MAEEPVICSICGGTGWKPLDESGTRRVVRCDCWRSHVADRLLADARIPKRYLHCTLDNFTLYENEPLMTAVGKARAFAEAFPVVDKGLFFIGPPGIGKSHLATAILRQAIETRGARGLFYDVRELLRVIRSTFSDGAALGEMGVLRPVMEVDLLVLDDLGAEKSSEWVGETLNLVVNTRYNENRTTIFTSNYDVNDEKPDDIDALQYRVGFRMYSRLREMCEFLRFEGADYRQSPTNAGPSDLLRAWKSHAGRAKLPERAGGPMRAQLRARTDPKKTELKWTGGKAGN